VAFIDEVRDRFGVEPVCRVLSRHGVQIAPRTYYAAKVRPPSARARRDAVVLAEIERVHGDPQLGRGLYGVRKVHAPGGRLDGLIQHSDAGSQYTSIRYSDRLAEAGAIASIGSVGDSYDNTQAESLIGLYKLECVRRDGPWRGVEDLELATLGWVHWFNHQRLHSKIGYLSPVE
jgi:transposase InsO family protein